MRHAKKYVSPNLDEDDAPEPTRAQLRRWERRRLAEERKLGARTRRLWYRLRAPFVRLGQRLKLLPPPLVSFDLAAGAKKLWPTLTPLRMKIPRAPKATRSGFSPPYRDPNFPPPPRDKRIDAFDAWRARVMIAAMAVPSEVFTSKKALVSVRKTVIGLRRRGRRGRKAKPVKFRFRIRT